MIVVSETVDDEHYIEATITEHELKFLSKNKNLFQKVLVGDSVINFGIRVQGYELEKYEE